MLYRFTAQKSGKTVRGTIEAADVVQAEELLRKKRLVPQDLEALVAGEEPAWSSQLRMLSSFLILIGVVAGLWSFFEARAVKAESFSAVEAYQEYRFRFVGRLKGEVPMGAVLVVDLPELPARLEATDDLSGQVSLERTLLIDEKLIPTYYTVTLFGKSGTSVSRSRKRSFVDSREEQDFGVLKLPSSH